MAIRPVAPGASMFEALHRLMREREADKRQNMLDGITVQNAAMQRQQIEAAMRRQAVRDQQDAEDRQRTIAEREAAGRQADNARGVRDMIASGLPQLDSIADPEQRRQYASQLAAMGYRENMPVPVRWLTRCSQHPNQSNA